MDYCGECVYYDEVTENSGVCYVDPPNDRGNRLRPTNAGDFKCYKFERKSPQENIKYGNVTDISEMVDAHEEEATT